MIKDKTGKAYQQEPSTIVKGGMSSDGMKVIEQYINPPVDKNVQQQLNQLWLENTHLFDDVNQ